MSSTLASQTGGETSEEPHGQEWQEDVNLQAFGHLRFGNEQMMCCKCLDEYFQPPTCSHELGPGIDLWVSVFKTEVEPSEERYDLAPAFEFNR
jgi:uncharacterized protein YaeQ